MTRAALAAYAIRMSTQDKQLSRYLPLGDLYGEDLLQVFQSFLAELKDEPIWDKDRQRLARLTVHHTEERQINATLYMGEHGFESDLIDVNDLSTMHHRMVDEAEMRPFHIIADLPRHADEGILLLQKHGQSGIKQIFVQHLDAWFKERYPEVRLLVQPLMPRDAFRPYFEKGRITKIRFIRYEVRSDIADAYDEGSHRQVEGSMELVVRAKRNKSIPLKEKILNRFATQGSDHPSPLIEISDFDYEDIKVEVTLGSTKRTVSLANPDGGLGVFDIDEDVTLGDDGFPTRESILREAQKIIDDLRSAMGMGE